MHLWGGRVGEKGPYDCDQSRRFEKDCAASFRVRAGLSTDYSQLWKSQMCQSSKCSLRFRDKTHLDALYLHWFSCRILLSRALAFSAIQGAYRERKTPLSKSSQQEPVCARECMWTLERPATFIMLNVILESQRMAANEAHGVPGLQQCDLLIISGVATSLSVALATYIHYFVLVSVYGRINAQDPCFHTEACADACSQADQYLAKKKHKLNINIY